MANYNSYPDFGIDSKIKLIQNLLSQNLGFDNVNFYGRVQKSLLEDSKLYSAEVHISRDERKPVYYDDIEAKGGNVFFIDEDKHKVKGNVATANVKIVFMLNLNHIYSDKTYRADSEVQQHCFKLVKKINCFGQNIELEKELKNVMKDFELKSIKLNDTHPYHTFSINGDLTYTFNCK